MKYFHTILIWSFLITICFSTNSVFGASGYLDIISSPNGVSININGKQYGATPLTGIEVVAGKLTIIATKKNYGQATSIYDIAPDELKTITIQLKKVEDLSGEVEEVTDLYQDVGELLVINKVGNKHVIIDGQKRGKGSIKIKNIAAGIHTLEIDSLFSRAKNAEIKIYKNYLLKVEVTDKGIKILNDLDAINTQKEIEEQKENEKRKILEEKRILEREQRRKEEELRQQEINRKKAEKAKWQKINKEETRVVAASANFYPSGTPSKSSSPGTTVKAITNKWSVGEDEWIETSFNFNKVINIYNNENKIIRRKHLQGNFSGEARCKVGFWNVGQEMFQRFNITIKMDNNVIFTKSSNTDAQTSRSYKYDIKSNDFTGKVKVYISSRGIKLYIDRNDSNLPKIPN